MDYLREEIEYVKFCAKQADDVICTANGKGRRRKDCPFYKACDENNLRCGQISTKMENSEELTEEEIGIIKFWGKDIIWDEKQCIPNKGKEQCPNHGKECTQYTFFCERLLWKLGANEPYEYDVMEAEIQKVI